MPALAHPRASPRSRRWPGGRWPTCAPRSPTYRDRRRSRESWPPGGSCCGRAWRSLRTCPAPLTWSTRTHHELFGWVVREDLLNIVRHGAREPRVRYGLATARFRDRGRRRRRGRRGRERKAWPASRERVAAADAGVIEAGQFAAARGAGGCVAVLVAIAGGGA